MGPLKCPTLDGAKSSSLKIVVGFVEKNGGHVRLSGNQVGRAGLIQRQYGAPFTT
jgi:ABC-type lipopolysaccharide export system ATPase subunit